MNKKAQLGALANVGVGAGKLFEMMKLPSWGRKIGSLRQRAAAGDEQSERLLSMLGVASVALGGALGMGVSRALGDKNMTLGTAAGGLLGAAPALLADEPAKFELPSAPANMPRPVGQPRWQDNGTSII